MSGGYPSYNDFGSRVSIELGTVYDNALNMKDDLDKIELNWTQAMYWWNQLKLNWVGKTTAEVDDFQQKIDKVRNELFGTSKPKVGGTAGEQVLDRPGLYQQVREVAMGATQNYFYTDFAVSNMFTQTTADITGTTYAAGTDATGTFITIKPSPKQTGVAPNVTDPPISETF